MEPQHELTSELRLKVKLSSVEHRVHYEDADGVEEFDNWRRREADLVFVDLVELLLDADARVRARAGLARPVAALLEAGANVEAMNVG